MIERWFRLRERGTSLRTEVVAGATTFLTMSYIIVVQPAVLSGAMFGQDTGMDAGAVLTATCVAAAAATALMGLVSGYPVAQAPGMGHNFFFVFSLLPAAAALGYDEPWRVALGIVLVAGVLFLALSLLGVRRHLIDALSPSMKHALGAGIGLFIAFIGLQSAGLVVTDPGTGVRLNPHLASPDALVFGVGLLVSAALLARRWRAALLGGIGCAFGAALALRAVGPAFGWIAAESMLATRLQPLAQIVSSPPSLAPTLLAFDLRAALRPELLPLVVLVLFMDLFDTLGTLVAVTQRAGLLRGGRLPRARRALVSDATGTVLGAALGTSTVTSFVESAAGVESGGRTGLVCLVVAALFLLALPFAPVVTMLGSYPPVTAPALVIVGGLMMGSARRIAWDDPSEAIPAFVALAGIPFTYSIADGIGLALITYPVVKFGCGRGREVGRAGVVLAALLLVYFVALRGAV